MKKSTMANSFKGKKIKRRYREYLGHDCYGYCTECVCGENVTGWTEAEANKNWEKHVCKVEKNENAPIGKKREPKGKTVNKKRVLGRGKKA